MNIRSPRDRAVHVIWDWLVTPGNGSRCWGALHRHRWVWRVFSYWCRQRKLQWEKQKEDLSLKYWWDNCLFSCKRQGGKRPLLWCWCFCTLFIFKKVLLLVSTGNRVVKLILPYRDLTALPLQRLEEESSLHYDLTPGYPAQFTATQHAGPFCLFEETSQCSNKV